MTTKDFRLFGGTIRSALVHAATQYDIRQARGKRHNPYALGQYLMRIDEVTADIDAGAAPRDALAAAFNDRLLGVLLVAIGESKAGPAMPDGRMSYAPLREGEVEAALDAAEDAAAEAEDAKAGAV